MDGLGEVVEAIFMIAPELAPVSGSDSTAIPITRSPDLHPAFANSLDIISYISRYLQYTVLHPLYYLAYVRYLVDNAYIDNENSGATRNILEGMAAEPGRLLQRMTEREKDLREMVMKIKKSKMKREVVTTFLSIVQLAFNFAAAITGVMVRELKTETVLLAVCNFMVTAIKLAEPWLDLRCDEKIASLMRQKKILRLMRGGCNTVLLLLPNIWLIQAEVLNLMMRRCGLRRAARTTQSSVGQTGAAAASLEVQNKDLKKVIGRLTRMVDCYEKDVKIRAVLFLNDIAN